ncbi:uncharacterized protein LOC126469627 [Schistocerca serialis cubense]|uniref:uncharacterized protein LOC126469627 n=1 Tax=Schistocerca serialis cubense TaxID=2023355 RepID=UPI00214E7F97|nr:uncharacterized protein LOC126469627 [Schistocerca serialis cubense]
MARPFFVPPTDEDIIEYYRILDQLLSDLMDILNVIFRGRRRLSEPTIRRGGRWLRQPAGLPDVVADAVRAAHQPGDARLCRRVVQSVDKLSSCYYDVSLQLHLIAESFRCRLQQEAEKTREPSAVVSGGLSGGSSMGGGGGGGVSVGGASLLGRLVPPQYGRPVCWTVIALYVGWRIICSR